MKKSLLCLIVSFFLIFITSCVKEQSNQSSSYVSVEINPSVEFVVDGEGKIVAANGTNDDGKTLIFNVSFEGLELSEGIDLVLEESLESGYILSATYNSDLVSREICISIDSENEEIAKSINENISNTVNSFIEEHDLAATYKQIEAKGREFLEGIVKRYNPAITDEELDEMSYQELLEVVELATIEKAQMISMSLEEYYLNFKESEFKFKYKEEIAAKLSEVNPIIAAGYNIILNQIKSAVDALNKLEYDIYISEDSQYLKLINQLNGYKDEVIKLNAQLAINENPTEIIAEIEVKNELIDEVTSNIETIMSTFKANLNTVRTQLNGLYDTLSELEKEITNIDFEAILTNVENSINDSKTSLCDKFESEFADEITNIKTTVADRKEALEDNKQ